MLAQEPLPACVRRSPPFLALLLLCIFFALYASACGTTSLAQNGGAPTATASPTASHAPVLACTVHTQIQGIDSIFLTLSCNVHDAASETSFRLTYSVGGPKPQPGLTVAPCTGALHNGSGTCTQTYALIAPYGSSPGSVEGELLPSYRHLGPVTPVVAA